MTEIYMFRSINYNTLNMFKLIAEDGVNLCELSSQEYPSKKLGAIPGKIRIACKCFIIMEYEKEIALWNIIIFSGILCTVEDDPFNHFTSTSKSPMI